MISRNDKAIPKKNVRDLFNLGKYNTISGVEIEYNIDNGKINIHIKYDIYEDDDAMHQYEIYEDVIIVQTMKNYSKNLLMVYLVIYLIIYR